MLHKYGLLIAKEEADKVDTLRYTWEKLLSRSTEVQNELVSLQPNFRGELIRNVAIFVEDCQHFYQDYDRVSPDGQVNSIHAIISLWGVPSGNYSYKPKHSCCPAFIFLWVFCNIKCQKSNHTKNQSDSLKLPLHRENKVVVYHKLTICGHVFLVLPTTNSQDGPMVVGLAPQDASDRLIMFQVKYPVIYHVYFHKHNLIYFYFFT